MIKRMKDSGIPWIGQIPKDWEVCRVKNTCSFINGYAFNSNELNFDGLYKVVRIGDVSNNINFDKCLSISRNTDLQNYKIQLNDILIAMSGATAGKIGLINTNCNAYVNQRVGIIRSDFYKYLYYCMQSKMFLDYIKLFSSSSAQPNISYEQIGNFKISINKKMANAIVQILDKKCGQIDELIKVEENAIEKLKEYKTSLITKVVTKGLDPNAKMTDSGISWIGQIPQDWKIVKTSSVYNYRNKIVNDREFEPLSVTKQGILPQLENVAKSDARDNRKLVLKNDFVINSRSDRKQSCGVSNYDGSVSLINSVIFSNVVLPSYTKYQLKNYAFAEEFYRWGNGIVADLWSTKWEQMGKIEIPLPSIKIQQQIVEYLDKKCEEIDNLLNVKQEKIEKLKEYKKSLIYQYVTGKKEVENES